MKDSYKIISIASEGLYKDKGSKFISYALPFDHLGQLNIILENIKSHHPKARHFCYAYCLGINKEIFKYNDDGEPSGTAGKPIYGQLLSMDVSDILLVVVRYFGGTKLGVSGLTQAYKLSAADALKNAHYSTKYLCESYRIFFHYADTGRVLSILKKTDIEIKDKNLDKNFYIDFDVRISKMKETLIQIKSGLLDCSNEEAALLGENFMHYKIQKKNF